LTIYNSVWSYVFGPPYVTVSLSLPHVLYVRCVLCVLKMFITYFNIRQSGQQTRHLVFVILTLCMGNSVTDDKN